MLHLNRIQLIGRIGQAPESREVGGTEVATASLATQARYRDAAGEWQDRPTQWHNLVLWRSLAARAMAELKKGTLVFVEGAIEYRSWEGDDGQKRYRTEVVVSNFRPMTPPVSKDRFPDAPPPARSDYSPKGQTQNQAESEDDDGLPF